MPITMWICVALVGLSLGGGEAALLCAQERPLPPGRATIHVLSDLVQVPVLALRPPFRPALSLRAQDFEVRLDGGPAFHPKQVRLEGEEPITMSVLVDADARDVPALADHLHAAVQSLPPELLGSSDRLSVYLYKCALVRSLEERPADMVRSGDAASAAFAPAAFEAAGGAKPCTRPDMARLLATVLDQIGKTNTWKVVLLVVSADHKLERHALDAVEALAAARGVALFAIKYVEGEGFPPSVYSPSEGLNVTVSTLGGVTLHASLPELEEVARTVVERVRQRYVLSFLRPANGGAGVHRIEVATPIRGVRILSSAAAASLLDSGLCTSGTDVWLCSEQRPQFGAGGRKKLP